MAEALERVQQCGADTALTWLCCECLSLRREDRPRDAGAVAQRVAEYQAQVQERLRQAELERAEAQVLRDCLKIREAKQPNLWTTFNTHSLLGGALLGQQKYAEAEPLLLQGYEGMKQRQDKIPSAYRQLRLSEALERVVQLCEASEQKEKAAAWRKQLQEVKPAQKKPKP